MRNAIVLLLFTTAVTAENATKNSTEPETEPELVFRSYQITCCRNGTPKPDSEIAENVVEWSEELVGKAGFNDSCNRFTGYYSLPMDIFVGHRRGLGVRCKCPENNLDRNCRYVPDCHNGGYRSFRINLRCVCPPSWFGELCEKFCYSGHLVKVDEVDTCHCRTHYYGEECNKVKCFNGGTVIEGRGCICQPPYFGHHCEIKLNSSLKFGRGHRSSRIISRDISGSIISLLLIVGLALLIYFLMKRKSQLLSRRRRSLAVRDLHFRGHFPDDLSREIPLRDPPPYTVSTSPYLMPTNQVNRADSLPPLPTYDDALKLPSRQIMTGNNAGDEAAGGNEGGGEEVDLEAPGGAGNAEEVDEVPPSSVQTEEEASAFNSTAEAEQLCGTSERTGENEDSEHIQQNTAMSCDNDRTK